MSACIETTYYRDKDGYGRLTGWKRFGKKVNLAHVLAWIDAHDCLPPEDKPFILHTCDNPPCINPEHLYAGTDADNVRDKLARGRDHNQKKTHCIHGHEFTPENTYVYQGRRSCKKCQRESWRRRH